MENRMRRVSLRIMTKRAVRTQSLKNHSLCLHHLAKSHHDIKNKNQKLISKDQQRTLLKKAISHLHHQRKKSLTINKNSYKNPSDLIKKSRPIQKY